MDPFTTDGKRKYLNAEELARFIAAAQRQERAEARAFCLVLAHTGARLSEVLALTVERVDSSSGAIMLCQHLSGQIFVQLPCLYPPYFKSEN